MAVFFPQFSPGNHFSFEKNYVNTGIDPSCSIFDGDISIQPMFLPSKSQKRYSVIFDVRYLADIKLLKSMSSGLVERGARFQMVTK